MKKLFSILLFFVFAVSFAQSGDIKSKITFQDGKEQIVKVRYRVNTIWKDLIDESSIAYGKIGILDTINNKVNRISTDNIQKIEFTDLKNKYRIFIRMPEYKNLVEQIYLGKIKWVRFYYPHGYDRSTQQADHLYKVGSKMVGLSLFVNNRKKLKELMSDRPDIFPMIEQINYNRFKDEQLISVLEKYDER